MDKAAKFRPYAYTFLYALLTFVAIASILAAVEGYYLQRKEIFSEFWLKMVFFASYWAGFIFLLLAQYRLANDHKRLYCLFTLIGAILIIIASAMAIALANHELSDMMLGIIGVTVVGGLINTGLAIGKLAVVKNED